MYHRVTVLPNDPHLLAVTPERFGSHLHAIRTYAVPMRLGELVRALRQGTMPSRAVVVTFDDGYADNLEYAKPLLTQYGVPATVFVTAGQVGSGREFWWDELDRLLLQPGTLPGTLRVQLNGTTHEWSLGEGSTYTEEDYRRDGHWNVECREDPGPRQRVFRAVFDCLYGLATAKRRNILDQLTTWAGVRPMARPTHEALTSEQAVRLADGDLIEIGAHTVTHPVLAALSVAEQRQEIQQSKVQLEAMLGHEVVSFAYPHGSSPPTTIATVGEAGFACACSSDPDAVFRGANLLRLPRLGVRNWDGDTFARWLRWWLDA
jgi:peptidoglycan/xylan/chitin deacetylase (PgdA/CDA1 family)